MVVMFNEPSAWARLTLPLVFAYNPNTLVGELNYPFREI